VLTEFYSLWTEAASVIIFIFGVLFCIQMHLFLSTLLHFIYFVSVCVFAHVCTCMVTEEGIRCHDRLYYEPLCSCRELNSGLGIAGN